jgi:hypothetical protein
MWKESATRASECTAYPTINSRRKKAESIPSRIIMRVDLESPMFAESERARSYDGRCAVLAKGRRGQTLCERLSRVGVRLL